MEGNTEKPFGIVRGITFSTMNMKRTNLAETEGNPGDQISTLIFHNVEVDGVLGNFKNKYCNVTFEKIKVNGTAFDGQ